MLARSTRPGSGPAPADVLIVGAGASGAVAAARFASQGFNVVCLEQRPWRNADEFPGTRRTLDVEADGRWHNNPNTRSLPEDYPCEASEADVHPLMFNAVGGSTIHFGAIWTRMHPSDFAVGSLDEVAEDWPLSYEDLASQHETIGLSESRGVCGRRCAVCCSSATFRLVIDVLGGGEAVRTSDEVTTRSSSPAGSPMRRSR